MSFAICSPPIDILAAYLFGRYRNDIVLRIAATVFFTGAMFRFLAYGIDEFWPIIVGTYIMALAASIFLNCQIIIANKWFPDKERAIAVSVLSLAVAIGNMVSYVITASTFVSFDEGTTSLSKEDQNIEIIESIKRIILY